jgi:hypothetical protein
LYTAVDTKGEGKDIDPVSPAIVINLKLITILSIVGEFILVIITEFSLLATSFVESFSKALLCTTASLTAEVMLAEYSAEEEVLDPTIRLGKFVP